MVTILYTRHAELILAERAIDRDWVERTIRHPESEEADPSRPGLIRAFRRLPERDGRTLRVVYAREERAARVITLFLDRGRR